MKKVSLSAGLVPLGRPALPTRISIKGGAITMKRFSFFLALMVGIGIILLANSTTTFAQGETGSVTGVVTDSQGGTVAGADVTLTDVATNLPKTTVTNESGRYHFAAVPAGLYDITISKAGFKVHKAAAQKVSVGNQLTLDVALEVGAEVGEEKSQGAHGGWEIGD